MFWVLFMCSSLLFLCLACCSYVTYWFAYNFKLCLFLFYWLCCIQTCMAKGKDFLVFISCEKGVVRNSRQENHSNRRACNCPQAFWRDNVWKGPRIDGDPFDWALEQFDNIPAILEPHCSWSIWTIWTMCEGLMLQYGWLMLGGYQTPGRRTMPMSSLITWISRANSIQPRTSLWDNAWIGWSTTWWVWGWVQGVWVCAQQEAREIVYFVISRANALNHTNMLIHMDKNVAYVGFINNQPKIWTIYALDLEWAQCHCLVANNLGYNMQLTIKY